ncbi:oxidoreductase, 2OG-Fe(II) oxygenase family [Aspergillus affinis]|uniref:oxidoreductase, 2OG-Fe(II) oxygenase family n=1 Tax=Aspergillus affinis TaxID=1070780 RepID=UPI0022FEF0CB|nr:oxidoreductase [Aspergillus affinis]KAI9046097.1 oxidoreductase [Aspergillus affinis]
MARINDLNAHERPPESIRQRYKKYQKSTTAEIQQDVGIIDLQTLDPHDLPTGIALSQWMSGEDLRPAFREFMPADNGKNEDGLHTVQDIPIYTHKSVSGLQIIPSLFPPALQKELLSRLLHRDVSNPDHLSNIHLHYDVTYPRPVDKDETQSESSSVDTRTLSFFEDDQNRLIYPKDATVHKPLAVKDILNKKLRWITLGGQYNWTTKEYPEEHPPVFPEDIANLLRASFPKTDAQAAILNFYTPGDTLSPHRDVSEECDVGLISISFGCDGLFLISHDDGTGCDIIRLRSGDAVYMDGTSRFAWHAVPKIIPDTCPDWLADWPVCSDEQDSSHYNTWKGWMSRKRINLNVRQMAS